MHTVGRPGFRASYRDTPNPDRPSSVYMVRTMAGKLHMVGECILTAYTALRSGRPLAHSTGHEGYFLGVRDGQLCVHSGQ